MIRYGIYFIIIIITLLYRPNFQETNLTRSTNKQISVIVIKSSVCITRLKLTHIQAKVSLTVVHFKNFEYVFSFVSSLAKNPLVSAFIVYFVLLRHSAKNVAAICAKIILLVSIGLYLLCWQKSSVKLHTLNT